MKFNCTGIVAGVVKRFSHRGEGTQAPAGDVSASIEGMLERQNLREALLEWEKVRADSLRSAARPRVAREVMARFNELKKIHPGISLKSFVPPLEQLLIVTEAEAEDNAAH